MPLYFPDSAIFEWEIRLTRGLDASDKFREINKAVKRYATTGPHLRTFLASGFPGCTEACE